MLEKKVTNLKIRLLSELSDQFEMKAPLIPGMEHKHEAIAVLVDFTEKGTSIKTTKLDNFRQEAALPFHASIPIEDIIKFSEGKSADFAKKLVIALIKLNVGIPLNIMRGDHNAYYDVVEQLIQLYKDTVAQLLAGQKAVTFVVNDPISY